MFKYKIVTLSMRIKVYRQIVYLERCIGKRAASSYIYKHNICIIDTTSSGF